MPLLCSNTSGSTSSSSSKTPTTTSSSTVYSVSKFIGMKTESCKTPPLVTPSQHKPFLKQPVVGSQRPRRLSQALANSSCIEWSSTKQDRLTQLRNDENVNYGLSRRTSFDANALRKSTESNGFMESILTRSQPTSSVPNTTHKSVDTSSLSKYHLAPISEKYRQEMKEKKRRGSMISLLRHDNASSKCVIVGGGESAPRALKVPPRSPAPPSPVPRRRKANSLSLIDYCNIMSMNTNFQMLSDFFNDTEESMARLNLKTTRSGNIQKLASLSEQMAALFGSSECACTLCTKSTKQTAVKQTPSTHTFSCYFELIPNKHNSDFAVITYSYSNPHSQLSALKLFNIMNTDCSIFSEQSATNGKATSISTNGGQAATTNAHQDHSTVSVASASSSSSSSIPTLPIIVPPISPITNTTSMPLASASLLSHVNNNSPPIYDPRYLYIVDCRTSKRDFERSHIHTAMHYTDLLNDSVYASPASYTLVCLYDANGTFLTSSSTGVTTEMSSPPHSARNTSRTTPSDPSTLSSDELIIRIKTKLQCSPTKTIHILSGGFEQFQATFPFMCSHLDIRSTVDRHKYLTIYPNCVIENQIYIGSGIQAKNWKICRDLRITHIINCSIEHECSFTDDITYLHVKIDDTYEENIYVVFEQTLQFIENAFDAYCTETLEREGTEGAKKPLLPPRFLIHCNLGISRSSSVLIAYLIARYKLCLYAAFNYVKDKRLQIAPNYSFLRQLKQFEETRMSHK